MMARKTFFSVAATLLFTFCAMATTPRVLILGDGGSEVFVKQALSDAGADVTVVSDYADWDGVTPSAANFDVIVLLDGLNYGSTMQNAAAAAISAHVAGGGGIANQPGNKFVGEEDPKGARHCVGEYKLQRGEPASRLQRQAAEYVFARTFTHAALLVVGRLHQIHH